MPNRRTDTLRRQIEGRTFTRATGATVAPLAEILADARRQLGYADHTPAGMTEPTARIRKLAATNGALSLRALLPEIVGTPSRPSMAETARPAGDALTLGEAVLANSRVLQAGAHLIALPEPKLIDGTAPAFSEVPAGLRVVKPAPLAAIALTAGEGTVTATPLADVIAAAALDRSAMTQRAFRVSLPRSTQKGVGEAQLAAEALHSIALGLGRAVDAQLLSALVAIAPAKFNLAAAAAKGLRFEELSAIIGTQGVGATTDAGLLYAACPPAVVGAAPNPSVPAELTADMAETLVGAFDRFGVVVSPEIEVLAERTDATGGLVLTCWLDMAALIPDAGFVWRAGS
ncbi:hypothetical protein ACTTAL_12740 [Rhodobacter capsulatus]|uniref:hypothetical protein n=1 Tax=Rhodobacter capsulatus TaxID=1061 RepID=UPI0003D33AF9|nr:hypothetical protein [Rhodobacter capsulatus]ETD87798.1 hypothetical protein U713_16060 [Rhodobacter capsulatus YW2]